MKASFLIVAAGSGSRLGAHLPKAFVQFNGACLLDASLRTVSELSAALEAVITIPSGMEKRAREIARNYGAMLPIKVIAGGSERQDSVRIGLALTSAEAELIAIHDAARPLAPAVLFESCLRRAAETGAAIAAAPIADTVKRASDGFIDATVSRSGLWCAQTPQVFRRELIIRAHAVAAENGWAATDDAELVERLGLPVALVESSTLNFKITTPDDLRLAELIAAPRDPR